MTTMAEPVCGFDSAASFSLFSSMHSGAGALSSKTDLADRCTIPMTHGSAY